MADGRERPSSGWRSGQIILALGEGLSNKAVAERLATRAATVIKWRGRFVEHSLAGVADAPRSGKPRPYDSSQERRIIAALDAPHPKGYARWDGSLLAQHLGNVSTHEIWRVLPNGKAITGFNHEYKRNGTTTLFAALEVATGLVKAGHYRRLDASSSWNSWTASSPAIPAARFTSFSTT